MKNIAYLVLILFQSLYGQLNAQCNFTVNAGPDIKVCNAGEIAMMAGKVTGVVKEVYWEPPTGLSDPKNPTSKVTVNGMMEYILVAKGLSGVNLVTNGNFESGKSGFFTDYIVGTMSCYGAGYLDCEGTYDVINNPQLGHTGFAACKDHTSGSGLMMVLNGSAAFQNIWCQNIPVMPDMEYILTIWVTSVVGSSPPIIQANINGMNVGPSFFSSGSVCLWEKYEVLWNSGSSTSADICFLNENTNTGGNDFAIDDISFVKICEKRDTVIVDVEEINIVIEDPGIVNCDRPQLRIDASGSSQGKNFTFKWNTSNGKIISGNNTLTPTIEGPGTYELTICSPLPNCCKKAFIEIMGNIKPPDLDLIVTDSIGCNNAFAIIYSKSNTNNLNYFWEGPKGFVSNDQNVEVTIGGTYILTIVDEFNCKNKKSIVVFENADNPKITIQSTNINCKVDSSKLVGNCSIKGSSLEWFGPNGFYSKTDSIVTRDSGLFVLKVKTPNGCIKFDSVKILKDKKLPQLTFSTDSIDCKKDSATIQVYSFNNLFYTEWKGLNPYRIIDSTKIRTKSAGIYKFIGIADNGCIDTVSIRVVADTNIPYIEAKPDTITCIKDKAVLYSGRKDFTTTIDWTGPGGFSSMVDSIEINIPGTYNLKATGLNSCTNQVDVIVEIDTIHPQLMVSNDTLTCLKDKLKLFLEDKYNSSYNWLGPNGFQSNMKNPEINLPGLYVIEAKLDNGCKTSFSIVIAEDKVLPIINYKNDTLNCKKDSLAILGNSDNANSKYVWLGPNNFSSKDKNPIVKSSGQYKLIVSNPNGCQDSILVDISQDVGKPDLSVLNDTINCKKTSVNLLAKSSRDSLMYQWTGPNGFNSSDSLINTAQAGKYKIKITTPESCYSELEVNIYADTSQPIISLQEDTLNCLKTKITLKIINTGSVINEYNWIGPSGFASKLSNPEITNGGLYRLQVSSTNYCSQSAQILILQDTVIPTVNIVTDTITCLKSEIILDAIVNPTNLIGTWTYSGNQSTQSNQLKTKTAGNYTFKVVGTNHCSIDLNTLVSIDTIHPDLQVVDDTITCGNTYASLDVISRTPNLNYSWSGPNGYQSGKANNITNLPGQYSILVTANNGCSALEIVSISIDTLRPLIVTRSDSIDCKNKFAHLDATITLNNAKVIWKNANQDSIGSDLRLITDKAGLYTITAINPENHCSNIAYVRVVEDSLIIKDVNINSVNPLCGTIFGSAQIVNIVGGHNGLKFSLDNGQNFTTQSNFESLKPGLYTLFVQDDKLCEFRKDFTITDLPFIETDLDPDISIQLGESGILDLNIKPNNGLIKSIEWLPNIYLSCNNCEDPEANPLQNMEYEVTVIDTNGCKSIKRILVKVEDPEVWVPNVFSPNGDQVNDWAFVVGSGEKVTQINIFQIFDRWGNLVFSNENFKPNEITSGWNGMYKAQECNPGVYVYWLEVELSDGKKWKLQGDLTLLR